MSFRLDQHGPESGEPLVSKAIEASHAARRTSPPQVDLSREIEARALRRPLDRVRCTHVFGEFYRCNWWSPKWVEGATGPNGTGGGPRLQWSTLTTHVVRDSRFLRAVMLDGALSVTEIPDRSAQPMDATGTTPPSPSQSALAGKDKSWR